MPKEVKIANKKDLKKSIPSIVIPESLEVKLLEDRLKAKKKRNSKTAIKKEGKGVEVQKDFKEIRLEEKIKPIILKEAESLAVESIEELSSEGEKPIIQEVSREEKIFYENAPEERASTRQEAKRRAYQEKTEKAPPAQPISQSQNQTSSQQIIYSTRAIYGAIEQKKERVYNMEEKSFQMANIIADRTPQPRIKEAGLFDNRLSKQKDDSHEEYSLNLKEQQPKKPRRRYPWEA